VTIELPTNTNTNTTDARGIYGDSTQRATHLFESDPQFRAATPLRDVLDAAREPGLRLSQVLRTLAEGYSDRPALGSRAVEAIRDKATGGTVTQRLPAFATMSYGELWCRVRAVASAWHHDSQAPIQAGDFVATIGFSSADYVTIDLVCGYLGLVAVPLQHNTSALRLVPILEETTPRVLAVSAAYLDLAVEAVLGGHWLSRAGRVRLPARR
jgi:fatty acid CoA ligase FadD9